MPETKISLFTLPVCSTEFVLQHTYWDGRGPTPAIRYGYYDETKEPIHGYIAFSRVVAMRRRAEICCTIWHIEGCYDQLVQIENSSWLAEIVDSVSVKLRNQLPELFHFMIYLDSAGCFEVIANKYEYQETPALPQG